MFWRPGWVETPATEWEEIQQEEISHEPWVVEGLHQDTVHLWLEAADTIAGRPTLVRFEWSADEPDRPRWQQSFSYDDGASWALNWQMLFSRA